MMILRILKKKKSSIFLKSQSNPKPCFGFSLIEVLIVIALLGLFVSIMVPTVQSLGTSKIRSDTVRVQGLFRETFVKASLSGQTHRIMFDMEGGEYWVEVGSEPKRQTDKKTDPKKANGLLSFLNGPSEVSEQEKEDLSLTEEEFKPVPGKKFKLTKGIRLGGIWADHLKEKAKTGKVPIYLFPDGYTQKSYIVLEEAVENGHIRVLVVEPLTGEMAVMQEEPDMSKEMDSNI